MNRIISAFLLLAMLGNPAYGAISPAYPVTLQNGTTADASQVMADFYQIQSDVNTYAAHNGANSDITSLTGLSTPLALQYGGTTVYVGGTTGGSGNAQTLATLAPGNFTLTAGNIVTGIAGYTNTGATTFNAGGTGDTAVKVEDSTGIHALAGGELYTGNSYTFYYDGTEFVLLNPSIIRSGNIPSSAALAGSPTTTTQTSSDNSTKIATTAFVQSALPTSVVKTVKQQIFTSGGTYTPSTGMLYATIRMIGGGGGGGGSNAGGGGTVGAGGGGAGEYAEGTFSAATVGASQTVTLGAGGSGGANSGATGSGGGTTSVGSLLTAVGGGGGQGPVGSGSSAYQNLGGAGGTGGSGTGLHTPGATGGWAVFGIDVGGNGASSPFGGGGKTGGYPSLAPTAGTGYGAGGGGGGQATAAGGAGSPGFVIITEYNSQ